MLWHKLLKHWSNTFDVDNNWWKLRRLSKDPDQAKIRFLEVDFEMSVERLIVAWLENLETLEPVRKEQSQQNPVVVAAAGQLLTGKVAP
jgi:hypothetical protein